MTGHQCFVDSNIILYAHDIEDPLKYKTANGLLLSFWGQEVMPSISIQVLQEIYANLIRKNMTAKNARDIIESYIKWNVIENDIWVLQEGMRLKEKLQLSIWDSFIIAAAKKVHVKYILSEDLSHNREYEGIRIINPFLK